VTVASGLPPAATLDQLADAIAADTAIAGLGESTRFAHETFVVRDQLFRRLARRHGFRALAVQDDAGVGAALDTYVAGGDGTASSALDRAWRPWRTAEMATVLEWIRSFNHNHQDDPIRIFGIKPGQAQAADYDAVLDHARDVAPHRLAELAAHLEPIRTARQTDEHVQRARGLHPGRPFAEHARDALTIVEQLPGESVLARMRRIVDFHEQSVAGRDNYAGDALAWSEAITDHHRRTGHRVAYWDGIAHTAAAPAALGLTPARGPRPTVGSVLRHDHGAGYTPWRSDSTTVTSASPPSRSRPRTGSTPGSARPAGPPIGWTYAPTTCAADGTDPRRYASSAASTTPPVTPPSTSLSPLCPTPSTSSSSCARSPRCGG